MNANPNPAPVRQSLRPAAEKVYVDLLSFSRGLGQEQERARSAWVATLKGPEKNLALFELEALLKGCAALSNSKNLPGTALRGDAVGHDYHKELTMLAQGVERSHHLVRILLGTSEGGVGFARYLESLVPDSAERAQMLQEHLAQDTPARALAVLSQALGSQRTILRALQRQSPVSHRLFRAVHDELLREVGRNAFFNPLVPLEFRPEHDRIRVPEILEAIVHVPSAGAVRVVTVTYLALLRILRYLSLVDQYAGQQDSLPLAYVALAVTGNDLRTVTRFVAEHAASRMADGFERDLFAVPSEQLPHEKARLSATATRLFQLRATLEASANALRVDTRILFDKELRGIDDAQFDDPALGAQLALGSADLRASIHHAIHTLTRELHPTATLESLGSRFAIRQEASVRLRRDLWMFSQVLRAFLAKAAAEAPASEGWESPAAFRFVQDFLAHFRAIGFQLVRSADYDGLGALLESLADLGSSDLVGPRRVKVAAEQCARLQHYMDDLFTQVSQRAELQEVPFDRRAAAASLRAYLSA